MKKIRKLNIDKSQLLESDEMLKLIAGSETWRCFESSWSCGCLHKGDSCYLVYRYTIDTHIYGGNMRFYDNSGMNQPVIRDPTKRILCGSITTQLYCDGLTAEGNKTHSAVTTFENRYYW